MKLSYREKWVLLVVTVLLIVLIFVLAPIKTIRGNIEKHKDQYNEIKVVYDENNRLINEIPSIEKNITKIYTDSKDLNKEFIVHKENFQIDQYLQEFVNTSDFKDGDKNKFEVIGEFSQEDADASKLEFYYYSPSILTYPILENADVNGDLLFSTDEALYKKVINAVGMKQLENQEIEKHSATVKVKFTKEALFAFLDGLQKKDTGMRVTKVAIDRYTFNPENLQNLAIAINDSSNDSSEELGDMTGYSKGEITFEFYTMQQIQEPKFD